MNPTPVPIPWETHLFLLAIPLAFVAAAVLAFVLGRGGRREP